VSASAVIAADQVMAVAHDVFVAMVDGEETTLVPWDGDVPAPVEPLAAWVDVHGPWSGRAVLVTELATARDLARAMLRLDADAPVDSEDLVDAFGEIANVVGGNLKSLLPDGGTLGLPQVADAPPADDAAAPAGPEAELRLSWRGRPLVVAVHSQPAQPEGGTPR
jgi:CheY-specific phosphatase CheX